MRRTETYQVEAEATSEEALVRVLVRRREQLGLSQRQLAEAAGVPQSTIGRIETGRTSPSLSMLAKIMRPLRLELSGQLKEIPMQPLYERKGAYIPRVAAIHDLCGYGKCSLGVAIPMLSAAGCDVCPVPTGLFSSHTAFPGWYMHDTTDILEDYLNAWRGINVEIDAVYSGFLGAPKQVEIIRDVWETYPNALRVVDPVMADHGQVYPTYTPELVEAMGHLANGADILTPNLTEAAIILGREWKGTDIGESEVRDIMSALRDTGAKNVVLKGIEHGDGLIHNYVWGESCDFTETTNVKLPYMLHGTGDVFASALLAAVMAGRTLAEATEFAADFTAEAMVVSAKQPRFEERGVSFETELGRVAALLD